MTGASKAQALKRYYKLPPRARTGQSRSGVLRWSWHCLAQELLTFSTRSSSAFIRSKYDIACWPATRHNLRPVDLCPQNRDPRSDAPNQANRIFVHRTLEV